LSVLDEGYYSNVLDEGLTRDLVCALNVISTFSLLYILFTESDLGDGLGLMNGYFYLRLEPAVARMVRIS
jgi:hypothetical protein